VRRGAGVGPGGAVAGAEADPAGVAAHLQQGRRTRHGQLPAARFPAVRHQGRTGAGGGDARPVAGGLPRPTGPDTTGRAKRAQRDKGVRILDEAGLAPERRARLPPCLELESPWRVGGTSTSAACPAPAVRCADAPSAAPRPRAPAPPVLPPPLPPAQ